MQTMMNSTFMSQELLIFQTVIQKI
ncbi:hypothetical protein MXB_2211 [Myxobolus squamalis]|nr:hypothetical protein MXB_2211 [Myxobolus squamalis]